MTRILLTQYFIIKLSIAESHQSVFALLNIRYEQQCVLSYTVANFKKKPQKTRGHTSLFPKSYLFTRLLFDQIPVVIFIEVSCNILLSY